MLPKYRRLVETLAQAGVTASHDVDPDGRHRGNDGRIHRSLPGETRYAAALAERHGAVTVFEVKTRTGGDFGHPCEAVGAEKLRRLHVLARAWARENGQAGVPSVDVVAVHWPRGSSPRVEHVGSIGWL